MRDYDSEFGACDTIAAFQEVKGGKYWHFSHCHDPGIAQVWKRSKNKLQEKSGESYYFKYVT